MTCSEIAVLAPLYLSGELDSPRTAAFAAHLDICPACVHDIARQTELDMRLRETLLSGEIDAGGIDTAVLDRRIRARIRTRRTSFIAGAVAAAIVLLLAGFAYRAFAPAVAPLYFKQIYVDAAADHRREVVERQPRTWRSNPAEVKSLAARQGISSSLANLLAPAGYRLEHAKLCPLSGHLYLHLVYSDGAHEISIFLRQRDSSPQGKGDDLRTADAAGEHLASFETNRVSAILVTEQPAGSARRLAHFAADAL